MVAQGVFLPLALDLFFWFFSGTKYFIKKGTKRYCVINIILNRVHREGAYGNGKKNSRRLWCIRVAICSYVSTQQRRVENGRK